MRATDRPRPPLRAVAALIAAVAGAASADACDLCSGPGPCSPPVAAVPGFRVCARCARSCTP